MEEEKELIERLKIIREKNLQDGLKEIEEILKKRKLAFATNIPVTINGQPVIAVLKSID